MVRRARLAVALASALVLAATAACYSPTAATGAPCAPNGECPQGQVCIIGRCLPPGTVVDIDASTDDAPDAMPDAMADAMVDAMPDAAVPHWRTPVELTSLETTGNGETDPSITTDRLTVVLAADTAANDADIWIGTRSALTDTFTASLLTAVNSTGFDDQSPEISADGKTLYFTSTRGGSGGDVYISTYTTAWSMPTIATDLSSTSDDGDVAISPDGLTAAVARLSGTNRIYIYTRAATTDSFTNATLHAELSVTADIAAPTITNGGAIIYLHAGATRDLYRATLKGNGSYTTPAPVTELNTAMRDAAPFVNQGDDIMIFERAGDIFETTFGL